MGPLAASVIIRKFLSIERRFDSQCEGKKITISLQFHTLVKSYHGQFRCLSSPVIPHPSAFTPAGVWSGIRWRVCDFRFHMKGSRSWLGELKALSLSIRCSRDASLPSFVLRYFSFKIWPSGAKFFWAQEPQWRVEWTKEFADALDTPETLSDYGSQSSAYNEKMLSLIRWLTYCWILIHVFI